MWRGLYLGVLLFCICLVDGSTSCADGGRVRLSERRGGYQVTVFTQPAFFRAGPVDISVLVQDADTGLSLPDAEVTVQAARRGQTIGMLKVPATAEAATNKLLRSAVFDLPAPGWWDMQVTVAGEHGTEIVEFALEATAPLPRWQTLWPWFAWPLLAILLFAIHQRLVHRKART